MYSSINTKSHSQLFQLYHNIHHQKKIENWLEVSDDRHILYIDSVKWHNYMCSVLYSVLSTMLAHLTSGK